MKTKTIQEIRTLLQDENSEPEESVLKCIQNDSRKGVQKLWEQWCKRKVQEQMLQDQYIRMSKYEDHCEVNGFSRVAGIDEVGRGPLAGPVVASAVILDRNEQIIGLNDSKALSVSKRESLYEEIIEKAVSIGVGMVTAEEIDRINIYEASKKAMLLAIDDLALHPDYLLIDAMKLPIGIEQESIIKGDAASNSIAAASIVAKVTRDRIMSDYSRKYPHYSFAANSGYATRDHLAAIQIHGTTPIHRKSFAPVSEQIKQSEKV
ncbi:ribonuclease HII [Alkalihalobacillus sp. AL-G]|uniref:ribonuclease HII n=1 Tax=Alkalihalobacillus sp. AL-G TaxID=2926399 RepID=UPI00272BEF68|nr:ribonuclease HII [Alkalihalobacillus sp. AL-G]WLD95134.1 ribonuclease HII [Alkalihalobacillus sp. AL-G]